jgi:hypothetical protein
LIRNPVHFPGLASVSGERLFKVGRVRGHVRPIKSNKDAFSVQHVLGVKLTPSIPEFADLWWIRGAILAGGPIETPLMSVGIV